MNGATTSVDGSADGAPALRPEARPLAFDQLDHQQQTALQHVVGLLDSATAAAARAPIRGDIAIAHDSRTSSAGGPYLEARRTSRNILVSGERGTGKTTLMLTLARLLSPDAAPREPTSDTPLPERLARQLDALRRRLVWLETLDMEPIDRDTNLLGAVLARVEEEVGRRLVANEPPDSPSPLYPGTSFHDASRELGRLQTSVALTFGGNLDKRGGNLDPDTFAIESRRAERERLGLDRRFAEVLAGLSRAVDRKGELTDPVFVLPVDDVDLNVGDAVRLLHLLRAVSSPHLVVLLAADPDLLSTVLRLWFQGELAKVAQPRRLDDDDARLAVDLAANALRKHLPPAQRVALGLVKPHRAMGVRPLGSSGRTLAEVLGPLALPDDISTLELSDAFRVEQPGVTWSHSMPATWIPETDQSPKEIAERLRPYSWVEPLRLPMRALVDLYLSLDGSDQDQAGLDIGHEDTPSQWATHALDRVRSVLAGSVAQGASLESHGSLTAPVMIRGTGPIVAAHTWHGWMVSLRSTTLGFNDSRALIGCAEVLGERWLEASQGLPAPRPWLACPRATYWPDAPDAAPIQWPWVTHSTFWAYERAMAWLDQTDRAWREADQPDWAFGSWVAVMTAQLFDIPTDGAVFDRPSSPIPTDWAALADRLARLDAADPGLPAQQWLDVVGMLCTPELGMTSLDDIPPMTRQRAGRIQRWRLAGARSAALPEGAGRLVASWTPPGVSPRGRVRPTEAPMGST